MSHEKGIQISFTSLTSGVHSQLVSNLSRLFSKFKVKKPSYVYVVYKSGKRQSEVTELTLARAEAFQLRQEIQILPHEVNIQITNYNIRKLQFFSSLFFFSSPSPLPLPFPLSLFPFPFRYFFFLFFPFFSLTIYNIMIH